MLQEACNVWYLPSESQEVRKVWVKTPTNNLNQKNRKYKKKTANEQ